MNRHSFHRIVSRCLSALCLLPALACAGPGAHGPDGQHLDGPGAHLHGPAADAPRLEAHSDLFELVATLADGELSILVDRYATNEPVLNGKVEVEAGKAKAVARFHADHGDYAIDDEAFLKAISQPGEHALVFTVTAGNDSDLLDGVLKIGGPAGDRQGATDRGRWWWPVVAAVPPLLGLALWRARRRSAAPRSAA